MLTSLSHQRFTGALSSPAFQIALGNLPADREIEEDNPFVSVAESVSKEGMMTRREAKIEETYIPFIPPPKSDRKARRQDRRRNARLEKAAQALDSEGAETSQGSAPRRSMTSALETSQMSNAEPSSAPGDLETSQRSNAELSPAASALETSKRSKDKHIDIDSLQIDSEQEASSKGKEKDLPDESDSSGDDHEGATNYLIERLGGYRVDEESGDQ